MLKCTMIFDYTNNVNRHAGWSESWYFSGDLPNGIPQVGFADLMRQRAQLLPSVTAIIGQRFTQIDSTPFGPGKSLRAISKSDYVRGAIPRLTQDVPQTGVLIGMGSPGLRNFKNTILRGLPDDYTVSGAIVTNLVEPPATEFIRRLAVNQFRFRCIDFGQQPVGIKSIAVDGTFSLLAPLAYNQGYYITLLRVRDINGKPLSGTFYVATKTDASNGVFANWPAGRVIGQSGQLRVRNFLYAPIDFQNSVVKKSAERKVGRPFDPYRGRSRRSR